MEEPPDHALGRSRGGFGTKIHLVCDSHGIIVAIHGWALGGSFQRALLCDMLRYGLSAS